MTMVRAFSVPVTPRPVKRDTVNFSVSEKPLAPLRLSQRLIEVSVLNLAITPTYAFAAPEQDVIPKEVDDLLIRVQLVCGGICVSVAIVMGMVAGLLRIIGLREEAKKRFEDACVGMIMVLTAPAVLGILATIVRGFLHLFPQYAVGA